MTRPVLLVIRLTIAFSAADLVRAAPPASELRARYGNGQVFLPWNERDPRMDAHYVIRSSAEPITSANVSQARVLARVRPSGAVEVRPTDRTWIGRLFSEGKDECQRLTPALHSFWYG